MKLYHENDDAQFPARRFTRPEPMIINSEPEWEVKTILDHRRQQNRHEFLIHWKGFPPDDDSWEPIENLDGSQELIAEYWQANGEPDTDPPTISSHYVRHDWEAMEVSVKDRPDDASDHSDFWAPYSDSEYDSFNEEGNLEDDVYAEDFYNPRTLQQSEL